MRRSSPGCVCSTYLYDVITGDVHLQVVFAVRLEAVVGEAVVIRSGEQVERVLRGHRHLPVVDVAQ